VKFNNRLTKVSLLARYFLLLCQKKVSKEKATRFRSKARWKIPIWGENVTRDSLASNRSNTRFLKASNRHFSTAHSNGGGAVVRLVLVYGCFLLKAKIALVPKADISLYKH